MSVRTLEELKGYLKSNIDEITLLEMLNISAEDIIERFSDVVEERYNALMDGLEEPISSIDDKEWWEYGQG